MRGLALVALCLPLTGLAAGPMGHNALAILTAERIVAGIYPAPPELKGLLADPKMRELFAGGSIGPDLFPDKFHRGNQSATTHAMLQEAQRRFAEARASGDAEAQRKAGENLAFAYGWLSHVATDLGVHPRVNATIGDTYDYNNEGEKLTHSALEAQLYAYLRKVAGLKSPFEAKIPYDFVANQFGIDEAAVRRATARLRLIGAGEIAAANQVTLTGQQLKDIWEGSVEESLTTAKEFFGDPKTFVNWDLDCGKISTADFEWLRNAVIELNGGSRPDGWGKNYLSWWNAVKHLPGSERAAALAKLLNLERGGGAGWGKESVPYLATKLSRESRFVYVRLDKERVWPANPALTRLPPTPVVWSGAKFSWNATFEDYPWTKTVSIEGVLASDELIASVKLTCTTKDEGRGVSFLESYEAKNIPFIEGGVTDEREGDFTFGVWNGNQAPAFAASFTTATSTRVWDRTNVKEWGPLQRSYPLLVVRFRLSKFGD